MNRALKSALIELRSDGVNLDPIADLEHILTLDKLSRKISEPDFGNDAALLRPVIQVGNVALRRISYGAQSFLTDVVLKWFPGDANKQDEAYLFCMCHSPEEIWPLQYDKATFLKTVKAWSKTVNVSLSELTSAAKRLLSDGQQSERANTGLMVTAGGCRAALGLLGRLRPIPEAYRLECEAAIIAMDAETDEKKCGFGPLVEGLIAEYGQTAEHWLWRVSIDEVAMLVAARNERDEAEARAVKGVQDDRLLRAHHAFVEYVELVRKLKKAKP